MSASIGNERSRVADPLRRHSPYPRTLILRVLSIIALGIGLVTGIPRPGPVGAQETEDLLRWAVSGTAPDSLPVSRNPNRLMGRTDIQQILIEIHGSPRDAARIVETLDGTGVTLNDLLAARLLREESGRYLLGFPLITPEEAAMLAEVSERFGQSFADAYLARWPEFEEVLGRYPLSHIRRSELAFVLVGCFSLDWDGLVLTHELGYRTVRREPPPRVTWAIDVDAARPRAVYWGSHNEYLDSGIAFTSFGDFHSIPRSGFPDLMWAMERSILVMEVPDELRRPLLAVARRNLTDLLEELGAIMIMLRGGQRTVEDLSRAAGLDVQATETLLALLEQLEYVQGDDGTFRTAIPVLTEEDRAMVDDLMRLSRETMTTWLEDNYEPYKAELMRVTPLGHSVPFEDSFWNTWHWLFGTVNRILVEAGVFDDPYADDRRFKGFVPVVWQRSLRAAR